MTGTAKARPVPVLEGRRHAAPLLLCRRLFSCPAAPACTPPLARRRRARPDAPASAAETLAPGVVHRAIPTGDGAGVDIVDVDLAHATARPAIVTGTGRSTGAGRPCTPQDWLTKTHALAAVNGGYFGQEDGDGPQGVRRPAGAAGAGGARRAAADGAGESRRCAPGRYVRSAFGLTRDGPPAIAWAAATPTPAGLRRAAHQPPSPAPLAGRVRRRLRADADPAGPSRRHGPAGAPRQPRRPAAHLCRLRRPGRQARALRPRHRVRHDLPGPGRVPRATTFPATMGRGPRRRCAWTAARPPSSVTGRSGAVQSPRFTGVTVPDAVVILPR